MKTFATTILAAGALATGAYTVGAHADTLPRTATSAYTQPAWAATDGASAALQPSEPSHTMRQPGMCGVAKAGGQRRRRLILQVARQLGIDPKELVQAHQAGTPLRSVLQAHGITPEQLRAAIRQAQQTQRSQQLPSSSS